MVTMDKESATHARRRTATTLEQRQERRSSTWKIAALPKHWNLSHKLYSANPGAALVRRTYAQAQFEEDDEWRMAIAPR